MGGPGAPHQGLNPGLEYEEHYRAEQERQSQWLTEHLGLRAT